MVMVAMTQILCVLKGGGEYNVQHVARLHGQLVRHAPGVEFSCLTDVPGVLGLQGVRVRGLIDDAWPKWWSKMAIYRIPGPCLYLDLDVNVVGDLRPMLDLAAAHDLIMWRDPQDAVVRSSNHVVNSSVVAWRGDQRPLYEAFKADPAAAMAPYDDPNRWREPGRGWGDMAYVRDHAAWKTWDDLQPGAVLSFKHHALRGKSLEGCRVLVSTGKLRPWSLGGADAWLAKHWHYGVEKKASAAWQRPEAMATGGDSDDDQTAKPFPRTRQA